MIGASGAVATILGAYAVTWPWARVRTLVVLIFITVVDLPALLFLGLWFLMQIGLGAAEIGHEVGQNVAWWAHVGGFIAGMLLMPLVSAAVNFHPWEEPPDPWGTPSPGPPFPPNEFG